jgi:hypothetical protein
MLSCQQTQNVIDGKKRIILNPSEGQRKDFETITFAEGEVYGIDVLVSSGEDGKVRFQFSPSSRIFSRCFQRDLGHRHGWKNRERRSISAITRYRISSR